VGLAKMLCAVIAIAVKPKKLRNIFNLMSFLSIPDESRKAFLNQKSSLQFTFDLRLLRTHRQRRQGRL
jgi:hypothetical protein